GGTIFLDEIAELPLQTQVRLLRVLETGEFIRVGSSKVQKTDVRVVAATNVNMTEAIRKGKFREDLFYRLNTIPIQIPALRERGNDIYLLFRKFANDFADKYRMPPIKLTDDAIDVLTAYSWPGNVRQLKNLTEQISIIESEREINGDRLRSFLPKDTFNSLPVPMAQAESMNQEFKEREILYKVLFDMRNDINDLKSLVFEMIKNGGVVNLPAQDKSALITRLFNKDEGQTLLPSNSAKEKPVNVSNSGVYRDDEIEDHEEVEETFSLQDSEKELIQKALQKHRNKRKYAARELGISERTLYRKIKEYNIAE
ncbi:MAG: sigma 54-interacting transcriptional regulator, partial [Flavobacteriales bacterium]